MISSIRRILFYILYYTWKVQYFFFILVLSLFLENKEFDKFKKETFVSRFGITITYTCVSFVSVMVIFQFMRLFLRGGYLPWIASLGIYFIVFEIIIGFSLSSRKDFFAEFDLKDNWGCLYIVIFYFLTFLFFKVML